MSISPSGGPAGLVEIVTEHPERSLAAGISSPPGPAQPRIDRNHAEHSIRSVPEAPFRKLAAEQNGYRIRFITDDGSRGATRSTS
jgi:hypothetical protein